MVMGSWWFAILCYRDSIPIAASRLRREGHQEFLGLIPKATCCHHFVV